jgi:hypothetical protein
MNQDAEKRAQEVIHRLRMLKGFCPLTSEEADSAYDAAPADLISGDDIESMIVLATSSGIAPWEPRPDLGWAHDLNTSEVEDDALQIHRNKSDDDGDTTEEDKLRKEMLSDDETEDENGVGRGSEPPAEGR